MHTLPPDLNAVMTDAERAEVGPIGDMTYGELENLVTKLSERMQANEHAYIDDVEAAAANGTIVEGVAEDSWKIDERMMARQHGATEADMPDKSLHDLHVESVMSGEIVDSLGGKKSYSKLNKKEKLNGETTQEQPGYGRFNSLRTHPLHPKSEEEAKKRQTLQVPGNCATGVEDAPVSSTCDAKIHEEIQTAKDNGIDVNYGHITEAQMRKQELDLLNEIQDFAKNKDYKRENPNYVEL